MSSRIAWTVIGATVFVTMFFASLLVWTGRYPVAVVGGKVITQNELAQNYHAATIYAEKMAKLVEFASSTPQQVAPDDLKAATLDQLVENAIIENVLEEELSSSEASEMIGAKLARYRQDRSLQNAATELFGLTYEQFEEKVLMPQAQRDIIVGRKFLLGEDFSNWLMDRRKSTNVVVISSAMRWNGEKIEAVK